MAKIHFMGAALVAAAVSTGYCEEAKSESEKPQEVPTVEKVIEHLKRSGERQTAQKFVLGVLQESNISASDDFKKILPPPAAQ